MKLETQKMGKNWWIVGDEEDGPYGPYDSRKEAEEDKVGLNRAERNRDNREFYTVEKEK